LTNFVSNDIICSIGGMFPSLAGGSTYHEVNVHAFQWLLANTPLIKLTLPHCTLVVLAGSKVSRSLGKSTSAISTRQFGKWNIPRLFRARLQIPEVVTRRAKRRVEKRPARNVIIHFITFQETVPYRIKLVVNIFFGRWGNHLWAHWHSCRFVWIKKVSDYHPSRTLLFLTLCVQSRLDMRQGCGIISYLKQ